MNNPVWGVAESRKGAWPLHKRVAQKMKTTGQGRGGQFEGPAQDRELEQRKG